MRTPRPATGLAVAAVLVLSVNLRPGATSVGPVLQELQHALGLSSGLAGVLTAMPGISFAIFGALAVMLAARTGLNGGLVLALLATSAGLAARALATNPWTFLLFTLLAFAGMAIGNVLAPAFIKHHFPHRTATPMAIYSTGLAIGASGGSLLAAPLSTLGPDAWRWSIGIWAIAAAAAAVLWAWLALREGSRGTASHRPHAALPFAVARSPKAVALGLFFGVQSMQAYVQFGWLAQILRDGGLPQAEAGLTTSFLAALGIPTSLAVPGLVARLRDLRPLIWGFGVTLAAGYTGVLLAPTVTPWLWALLLGLSGGAFPAALTLITARTRRPQVTGQLSGFTQSLGYTLAALGPFAIGLLHQLTGGWTIPLLLLLASAAVMVWAGLVAAAPGFVDDDLGETAEAR